MKTETDTQLHPMLAFRGVRMQTTSIYAERSIGNENGPAEIWFVATGQPGGRRFREFSDAFAFAKSIANTISVHP